MRQTIIDSDGNERTVVIIREDTAKIDIEYLNKRVSFEVVDIKT